MDKIYFDERVGIIINNSCNMSCEHCLTFNNFDLKGVFSWETHADKYTKWAELISFEGISLQGGEPYLNPELTTWAENIIRLFPTNNANGITTNGTLLGKNIEKTRYLIDLGWVIFISIHDKSQKEKIVNAVEEILSVYDDVEIEVFDEDPLSEYSYSNHQVVEYKKNGKILIQYVEYYDFFPSPQFAKDGVISFNRGDTVKNHERCMASPCSMFIHGKFYKCSLLSMYEEASKQIKFEEDALSLLKEYKGCDPFDDEENIKTFIDTIKQPVPQCQLCPYGDINPEGSKEWKLYPVNGLKPKLQLKKPT